MYGTTKQNMISLDLIIEIKIQREILFRELFVIYSEYIE
jgi:hypothetical protein